MERTYSEKKAHTLCTVRQKSEEKNNNIETAHTFNEIEMRVEKSQSSEWTT